MKVSFDLDDTLFVSPDGFETEAVPSFTYKWKYKERLRKGTIELFEMLNAMGVEIWIYTTSFRSERYIRGLFRCYGLEVENIVNGERHAKEVQGGRVEAMPSKYPSRYRIDLHIDDDVSVAQNGRVYGFKVFIVGSQDDNWVEKIAEEVEKMKRIKGPEGCSVKTT